MVVSNGRKVAEAPADDLREMEDSADWVTFTSPRVAVRSSWLVAELKNVADGGDGQRTGRLGVGGSLPELLVIPQHWLFFVKYDGVVRGRLEGPDGSWISCDDVNVSGLGCLEPDRP